MEIKYEIHNIENSQGTGEKRAYVQLRNNPAMTTDELGKEVEQACSVTSSDLKAVMAELATIAVRELSQGNRFYLPEIGYLSLAVGNVPPSAKTNGKITGKDIYLRSINFRPEKKLLRMVQRQVRFVKSDYSTLSANYGADELWARVSAYLSVHCFITRRIMCVEFGLSDYKARKWLELFIAEGRLVQSCTRPQALYFLKTSE
jgi:predicted histone-like DNA-binding protein